MSENGKIGMLTKAEAESVKENFRKYLARRKYRTGCNCKNMRQLNLRVSAEVHDFFEVRSWDEMGRKLSKPKVLEYLIAAVGSEWFPPRLPKK